MRRKVTSFMLALLLTAAVPFTASAETVKSDKEMDVKFDGNKIESTFSTKDIDFTASSMQPGDTMEIEINLENTSTIQTKWYMTNEVLSTLEQSVSAAQGGAYTYRLSYVNPEGEETLLYNSDTVAGENTGKDALQNVTSSLEDYFYLDDLAVGENAKVLLTVGLDGETQGNSYQNTFAELQMNFAVENGETKKIVQAPHTGDSTQMGMYGIVALVAGLGCMLLLFFRLKDGRKAQAEKEGR